MYAIKSKRTGRFYSEQENDWLNGWLHCTYSSSKEAEDVADMYCDRNMYVVVKVASYEESEQGEPIGAIATSQIAKVRQAAIAEGKKRYIGNPCHKCGGTERFTVSLQCIACHRVRNLAAYHKKKAING